MKTLNNLLFTIILNLILIVANIYAQEENGYGYNPDFSVYCENYFSSYEQIKIRIKSDKLEKAEIFFVKIYKITDIIPFLMKQEKIYNWDVFTPDAASFFGIYKEMAFMDMELIPTVINTKEGSWKKLDTSIFLPELDKGVYLVKVQNKKKISNLGFIISDISLVTKNSENMILCYTVDRYSGKPVDSVKLACFFGKVAITSAISNNEGIGPIIFSDSERAQIIKINELKPLVIGTRGDDLVFSDPSFFFNPYQGNYRGYIYTSQPVYRPANIVNFKGTIRRYGKTEIENLPMQDIFVTIKDSRGTVIYGKTLATNDNGTFSDSIALETGATLGKYTINAGLNEKTFTGSFEVEEYKKPEYTVGVNVDKNQYSDGDEIKGTIDAKYYFESPVQDADVEYKIFKKPFYKPWWYYSSYRWWYDENSSYINNMSNYYGSEFIFTGKGRLDKDGKFELLYKINEKFTGREKDYYLGEKTKTDFTYVIEALVTDKSRRQITGIKTTYVTRADFVLTANTDRYLYKPGDPVGISVFASDLSDAPVAAQFNMSVTRLTWDKGNYNRKFTKFVKNISGETNKDGRGIAYLIPDSNGYYSFEVNSFDQKKRKITATAGCCVSNGNMDWWYNTYSNDIMIVPDKISYMHGDTIRALVVAPLDDINLLVTVNNRNILSYKIERFEGSTGYIEIPINNNFPSNCTIDICLVKNGKMFLGSKEILIIPQTKFLDINVSSDKNTYKPHETGHITAKVTDINGNPVKNAEVCLSVIDESVYAVKNDDTKDIRTFFYPSEQYYSFTMINHLYSNLFKSRYATLKDIVNLSNVGEYDYGIINGKLRDKYGAPFRNANILINNEFSACVTDYYGVFSFKLPEGAYTLSISDQNYDKIGYIDLNVEKNKNIYLDIISSEDALMEINMIDDSKKQEIIVNADKEYYYGTITGKVTDNSKSPIEGAIVQLEGTSKGAETDSFGNYSILKIKSGVYTVICRYTGLSTAKETNVVVKSTGLTTVNFELSAGNITCDTLMVIAPRKGIDVEESGRQILKEQIDDQGMHGIQNITSKTAGVIQDELNIRGGRSDENLIIVDGIAVKNPNFIEPELRKNFSDAIFWTPSVFTDENGEAKIDVTFPDNLTTWRITARVITNDTKIGQTTNTMISRKDLIIRMETPRFLQNNDAVTISTIVHNYLNDDKITKVSLNADNLIMSDTNKNEKIIKMRKNEERRIDWMVKVKQPDGIATLTAKALTDEESDAVQYKVPLQESGLPVTQSMAFDFSDVNKTETRIINIPEGTDLRSSKLKINVSPSLSSSIFSSLDQLIGYPYGCVEQTMSRFLPTVIVANIYKKLNIPFDPNLEKELPKMVKMGFDKLYSMQHGDGGWGWWVYDLSNPYMSAYVMYGLSLSKAAGFNVDSTVLKNGKNYLVNMLGKDKTDHTTLAFELYSLSSIDRDDPEIIRAGLEKLEEKKLSDFANSLLSLTASNISDTAHMKYYNDILYKHRESDGNERNYWGGKIFHYRWEDDKILTTSLALKALLGDKDFYSENNDIIEKSVNWLLNQRNPVGWGNTVQNAFIVYSLADFMEKDNGLEPEFAVKIFINGTVAGEKKFTKDDVFKRAYSVDIDSKNLRTGDNEIKIEKTGRGRMYFSSNTTYYSGVPETHNNGFKIEREYYSLSLNKDFEGNTYGYEKENIGEKVKSGDLVFVKIKVKAKQDNSQYFMLEDPIPAGCEVVKDDWAYQINGEKDYSGSSYDMWRWWYADKEVHDNRVSFFATNLYGDEYEFSYILRAQIPGKYNINPTMGVLMYYPEVNGSSESMKLVIGE